MQFHLTEKSAAAIPLVTVSKRDYKNWLEEQSRPARKWLEALAFEAEPATHALVPAADGSIAMAVAGIPAEPDIWSLAHLPSALPAHTYKLVGMHSNAQATQFALGWAWGAYRFSRYKKHTKKLATLVVPKGADANYVRGMAESAYLARDLINTPASDMLPTQLAEACADVAKSVKAKYSVITGEALLKANYPTIYTVGKGSADPARLIDIRWGKPDAPKVTLVGKGVCFDSGGLDIKSSAAMRLMKKDMAGGAILLALARLIIEQKLNVNLRLLIPAVENAVDGRSMRPLDIIRTRKGITVEVGNTDAEGRLILCDALAEADSEKPDLLIDCATLTGAARVALGTDTAAFFTPDDRLAAKLANHSVAQADPMYRLPLIGAYRDMMKSRTADLSNDSDSAYAGAITAAIYLKEFVEHTTRWIHVDMMAWNLTARPGRPIGAEPQGLRALFALIKELYG